MLGSLHCYRNTQQKETFYKSMREVCKTDKYVRTREQYVRTRKKPVLRPGSQISPDIHAAWPTI